MAKCLPFQNTLRSWRRTGPVGSHFSMQVALWELVLRCTIGISATLLVDCAGVSALSCGLSWNMRSCLCVATGMSTALLVCRACGPQHCPLSSLEREVLSVCHRWSDYFCHDKTKLNQIFRATHSDDLFHCSSLQEVLAATLGESLVGFRRSASRVTVAFRGVTTHLPTNLRHSHFRRALVCCRCPPRPTSVFSRPMGHDNSTLALAELLLCCGVAVS